MIIKLTETLRIKRYDDRNIVIEQDVESERQKTGEKYISQKPLGYFPTVESALLAVIDRGLLESKVNTLDDYINDIRRIKDDLKREINIKGEYQNEKSN